MRNTLAGAALAVISATASLTAVAQAPVLYGAPISIDMAKKAAAAAIAEARKANLLQAIAVTDPSGNLVYFERMDGVQIASGNIAIGKARSAALFKRPTKALEDALSSSPSGARILALEGAVPVEGGIPIVVDGRIVGAIAGSGGTGTQDGQVAQAGANALQSVASAGK
jgi:glc operon protein GlcG